MPLVSSNSLEEKSKITESPAEAKNIYLVLHPFIKRLICTYSVALEWVQFWADCQRWFVPLDHKLSHDSFSKDSYFVEGK